MAYDTPDSCESLRTAIRAVAPAAVLIRVYPKRRAVTHVFRRDFDRALIGQENEMVLAHIVRQYFGGTIDWRSMHDFHLPTGHLYLSPRQTQLGYIPEYDLTFGMDSSRLIRIGDGKYDD